MSKSLSKEAVEYLLQRVQYIEPFQDTKESLLRSLNSLEEEKKSIEDKIQYTKSKIDHIEKLDAIVEEIKEYFNE